MVWLMFSVSCDFVQLTENPRYIRLLLVSICGGRGVLMSSDAFLWIRRWLVLSASLRRTMVTRTIY